MAARDLLPNDEVIVHSRDTLLPIACGLVWPGSKVARDRAHLPCVELDALHLHAAGNGTQASATMNMAPVTPVKGFNTPTKPATASLAVDIVQRSGFTGPSLAPCAVLYVERPVQARGTAAGAALAHLKGLLLGAAVPATGASFSLGEQHLQLTPFPCPSAFVYVTRDTRLVEGAPTAHASSMSTPSVRSRVHVGGLQEQVVEITGLIRAALASSSLPAQSSSLRPARGVLLVGPAGTGKTLLARHISQSLQMPFTVINGPEVLSSVVGEAEETIRHTFRRAAGGILFIDELDGLAPARTSSSSGEVEARIVATLLTLLDGLQATSPVVHNPSAQTPAVRIVDALEAVHAPGASPSAALTASATSGPVFILAATNRASAVDPALRRPGRFDREIEIPIPSASARVDILRACLATYPHDFTDKQLQELADTMHGYVGADIASVCREAAFAALQRIVGPQPSSADTTGQPIDEVATALSHMSMSDRGTPRVLWDDVKTGLRLVQPSAIREIAVEVPTVSWADIGGQEDVKQQLHEAVEWPLTHADAFTALGIRPPKGVLLYGPPGCSKTMMARAIANGSVGGIRMNFISVKGPELLSKYVGDSEKAVAEVFKRARAAAPCVIFFDEFDSLAPRRSGGGDSGGSGVSVRVVSQLLTELDGISGLKQVVIIAATNRPDLIDPALLRPGRVDRMLYVGLPDAGARLAIVRNRLLTVPCEPALTPTTQLGYAAITSLCADSGPLDGYSGAEIVGILREASLMAVREYMLALNANGSVGVRAPQQGEPAVVNNGDAPIQPALKAAHIVAAARCMPKGVTRPMLDFYDDFRRGMKGR